MAQELEVGDIVMCTVDRIVGTVVFVKIDGNGEGGIILSEVSPGRIRNLRDYIVPKKKIVCKVLRISGDRIDLSLRRVTQKEQKEVKEQYKQEKSYINILKSVLKEKAVEAIEEISKQEKVYEFLQEAKKNPEKLGNLVGKIDSKKILEILNSQKQKKANIKKEIFLTTTKSNGLELIKKILVPIKEAKIRYISAGKYSIKKEGSDLKTIDSELRKMISAIEKKSKECGADFNIKIQ